MRLIKLFVYSLTLVRIFKNYYTEIVPNDFKSIDENENEIYISTNIKECFKVCFKQTKENTISDIVLEKYKCFFLKIFIKILAFIYCIKGVNTEIHFADCKSNEITNEYIYTNIYKIFLAYYSTMISQIYCQIEEL